MSRQSDSLQTRLGRLLLAAVALLAAMAAHALDFDDIANQAKALAAAPYQKPDAKLPKQLADLGYDHYRDIHFKSDRSTWRNDKLPFELQYFHEGLYYSTPVKVNEVSTKGIRELRYNAYDFDFGQNKIDYTKMQGVGLAGFRVHYPINTPKYKDEVLLFLGASYFRALGKGQRYGLSARALAVDTALISGEEFPRFTEFWLLRPKAKDSELTVYALLDSKSVAGAYQFVLHPGTSTELEVKARIYMRSNVSKLGIAPLTSMYFSGENQHTVSDDYRPEVHDSDGLLIESGTGEWLWRPLVNPKRLLVTSFALDNPVGFGLMQRDRNFDDYQDLEARYDLRPSAWIEPQGRWGAGRVELVQIPTPDETNDNVVAYWVPDTLPQAGQSLDIAYRVQWQMVDETHPPQAWVTQSRRGRRYSPTADDSIGFTVDFSGPALEKLKADDAVEGIVSVDANGELLERNTMYNPVTHGRRLSMRVRRTDPDKPVEIRAYLRGNGSTGISETWSYILPAGGP
jgi:glucans biosynthesis protein